MSRARQKELYRLFELGAVVGAGDKMTVNIGGQIVVE
jgi:hypothetical protein